MNVDEALNDPEFLQLINSLVKPPDLKPTTPQKPTWSNLSQDSLDLLEANIVSTL